MSESKCPFHVATTKATTNKDWWPNQLNLKVLHASAPQADPLGPKFDYAKEFKSLDLKALKKDLEALMMTVTAEYDVTADRAWQLFADPRQFSDGPSSESHGYVCARLVISARRNHAGGDAAAVWLSMCTFWQMAYRSSTQGFACKSGIHGI